jgi:dTDP-4-dehydrorhamnose 3,5-epimerase
VQLPPRSTRKLVFVVSGEVRDFVLDLRVGSPTEGEVAEFRLDGHRGGLVIPEGCAHGFEVLSDSAAMVYAQEEYHGADEDSGILYSSAGIVLESADAVVSARDLALPSLASFSSPFRFA